MYRKWVRTVYHDTQLKQTKRNRLQRQRNLLKKLHQEKIA
jgi:hypothetical protein